MTDWLNHQGNLKSLYSPQRLRVWQESQPTKHMAPSSGSLTIHWQTRYFAEVTLFNICLGVLVRAVKSNKNFGCSEDNERLRAKDQMFSIKRCPFCRDIVRTVGAVS